MTLISLLLNPPNKPWSFTKRYLASWLLVILGIAGLFIGLTIFATIPLLLTPFWFSFIYYPGLKEGKQPKLLSQQEVLDLELSLGVIDQTQYDFERPKQETGPLKTYADLDPPTRKQKAQRLEAIKTGADRGPIDPLAAYAQYHSSIQVSSNLATVEVYDKLVKGLVDQHFGVPSHSAGNWTQMESIEQLYKRGLISSDDARAALGHQLDGRKSLI
jgi:hypothetical protein